jgi:sugar lactone lactonase YvrE/DNA-directed RNA polymerase subunit RPC12/RpoP
MTTSTTSFTCPYCGAALSAPAGAPEMACPRCGREVLVPQKAKPRAGFNMLTINLAVAAVAGLFGLAACLLPAIGAAAGLFGNITALVGGPGVKHTPAASAAPTAAPIAGYAQVMTSFGGAGTITLAQQMDVDDSGTLYVLDNHSGDKGDRLQKFTPSGKLLQTVYLQGDGVSGMAVSADGHIYIVDADSVQVLNPDGTPAYTIDSHTFGGASMARTAGGSIYILGVVHNTLQRFDKSGQLTLTLPAVFAPVLKDRHAPEPVMAADGAGNVAVVDTIYGILVVYDSKGKLAAQFGGTQTGAGDLPKGPFEHPQSIAMSRDGRIYVGDLRGIFIFSRNGQQVGFVATRETTQVMRIGPEGELIVLTGDGHIVIYKVQKAQ